MIDFESILENAREWPDKSKATSKSHDHQSNTARIDLIRSDLHKMRLIAIPYITNQIMFVPTMKPSSDDIDALWAFVRVYVYTKRVSHRFKGLPVLIVSSKHSKSNDHALFEYDSRRNTKTIYPSTVTIVYDPRQIGNTNRQQFIAQPLRLAKYSLMSLHGTIYDDTPMFLELYYRQTHQSSTIFVISPIWRNITKSIIISNIRNGIPAYLYSSVAGTSLIHRNELHKLALDLVKSTKAENSVRRAVDSVFDKYSIFAHIARFILPSDRLAKYDSPDVSNKPLIDIISRKDREYVKRAIAALLSNLKNSNACSRLTSFRTAQGIDRDHLRRFWNTNKRRIRKDRISKQYYYKNRRSVCDGIRLICVHEYEQYIESKPMYDIIDSYGERNHNTVICKYCYQELDTVTESSLMNFLNSQSANKFVIGPKDDSNRAYFMMIVNTLFQYCEVKSSHISASGLFGALLDHYDDAIKTTSLDPYSDRYNDHERQFIVKYIVGAYLTLFNIGVISKINRFTKSSLKTTRSRTKLIFDIVSNRLDLSIFPSFDEFWKEFSSDILHTIDYSFLDRFKQSSDDTTFVTKLIRSDKYDTYKPVDIHATYTHRSDPKLYKLAPAKIKYQSKLIRINKPKADDYKPYRYIKKRVDTKRAINDIRSIVSKATTNTKAKGFIGIIDSMLRIKSSYERQSIGRSIWTITSDGLISSKHIDILNDVYNTYSTQDQYDDVIDIAIVRLRDVFNALVALKAMSIIRRIAMEIVRYYRLSIYDDLSDMRTSIGISEDVLV